MTWPRKPSGLSAAPTNGSQEPVFTMTPEEQARFDRYHGSNQFGR